MPNDERSSTLEWPRSDGITVGHSVELRHFDLVMTARLLFLSSAGSDKKSGPILRFCFQRRVDRGANALGVFIFWIERAVINE